MILLPAIDMLGGRCVQLSQGDFATSFDVAGDPLETAKRFKAAGAEWVHMVDLDGAKTGIGTNREQIMRVAERSGLLVELGGGIRDMETIDFFLGNGIERVVLGTAALVDPDLVAEAVGRYADRIAVGIDARDGKVMVEAWLKEAQADYLAFAKQMEALGVEVLIFTDIIREGMLGGVDIEPLRLLKEAVSCRVISSGGIKDLSDIRALAELGIYGAICGKAVYTGDLDLNEALAFLSK